MEVNVFSLDGKVKEKIELPSIFLGEIREDLIKRAVLSSQSRRFQPKGRDKLAGKRTSAESWGAGYGVSRVPRIKGSRYSAAGRGAFVPMAVGGRIAFPPLVEKKIVKRINVKERRKAILSAIAATADRERVKSRGHKIEKVPQIPVIVDSKLEELKSTKDVEKVFEKLGLIDDINRAKKKKIRAGKGKMRGRKYKRKKSVLIVIGEDKGIKKAARNLPGVDVVYARNLCVEDLAPGTHAGRLTVYTLNAIQQLKERFSCTT